MAAGVGGVRAQQIDGGARKVAGVDPAALTSGKRGAAWVVREAVAAGTGPAGPAQPGAVADQRTRGCRRFPARVQGPSTAVPALPPKPRRTHLAAGLISSRGKAVLPTPQPTCAAQAIERSSV